MKWAREKLADQGENQEDLSSETQPPTTLYEAESGVTVVANSELRNLKTK